MKAETSDQKIARLRALREARDHQRPNSRANDRGKQPDYPVYCMSDELRFGKHRGETVESILESDPGWIRWALENVSGFAVDPDVEDELHFLDDPRRPIDRGSRV